MASEAAEKQSMHFVEKGEHFYSLLRDQQLILRSLGALKILRMNLWLYYNSVHRLIDLTIFLLQSLIEREKNPFAERVPSLSIINH